MGNVGFGRKYEFKTDSNPAVGQYHIESGTKLTKSRGREAMILNYDDNQRIRPAEVEPEVGQYQKQTITFGSKMQRVGFGSKYDFKVDGNPKVGYYNPESAEKITKPKTRAASINRPGSTRIRPPEVHPEIGQYDNNVMKFGSDTKSFKIGAKYDTKYDPSLGPGTYEADKAMQSIMPRSKSTAFKSPRATRLPQRTEISPDADDRHVRPFGSELKGINFGRKYEFKADDNPKIGQYEPERAEAITKTRARNTYIAKDVKYYERPPETLPDPGQYDGHIRQFGSEAKSFKMGQKYEEKYDANLGPGSYEPDRALLYTMPKTSSTTIKQPSYKVPRREEIGPEADDKHIKPIGSGMAGIDFGSKYEFRVDSNPRVGQYNVNDSQTKSKTRMAIITEEKMIYRKPREYSPDPGQYDRHIKEFGSDVKSFTIGGKYQHKYDPTLGPGTYEASQAILSTLPKSQSLIIREPAKSPQRFETLPEADDKHIKPIGSGLGRIDFGRKYEFKVDNNPRVGQYTPQYSQVASKT